MIKRTKAYTEPNDSILKIVGYFLIPDNNNIIYRPSYSYEIITKTTHCLRNPVTASR